MCVVSMISDYYMKPIHPNVPNPHKFDNETKHLLLDIIKRLDELDKKLGDRDCMDDVKKEFFDIIGYKD